MKLTTAIVACSVGLAAAALPSSETQERERRRICSPYEESVKPKCPASFARCLERQSAKGQKEDETFWDNVQACTGVWTAGPIGPHLSVQNTVATFVRGTKIFCKEPKNGFMDCRLVDKSENESVCVKDKQQLCRESSQLGDICQEHGGCDSCRGALRHRINEPKLDDFNSSRYTCKLKSQGESAKQEPSGANN